MREKGVKAPVKATAYQDEAGEEVHPGHKQLRDCIASRYSGFYYHYAVVS